MQKEPVLGEGNGSGKIDRQHHCRRDGEYCECPSRHRKPSFLPHQAILPHKADRRGRKQRPRSGLSAFELQASA
jgi:hypothetical protein